MKRRSIVRLPKAHLHLHLEGSARPSTIKELAELEGMPDADQTFSNLPEFVQVYAKAAAVIRRPESLKRICRELVEDEAAQGVWYTEPMGVPQYLGNQHPFRGAQIRLKEFDTDGAWAIMQEGFAEGTRATGTEVGLMMGINRGFGVDGTVEAARFAARNKDNGIVAFGIAGDERIPPEPFAPACHIAREAGLLVVPHAGEAMGPESVWAAIKSTFPHRIAHGVRAVEDPFLLSYLSDHQITCDVAPTSNLLLGVAQDIELHQLPKLMDAGVPITLNTDDQLFFGALICDEYRLVRDTFNLTDGQLADFARVSARASGAPEHVKQRILNGIDAWLESEPDE